MSYDSFHRNADRIYRVHTNMHKWAAQGGSAAGEIYDTNPYPLANWLKSEFPEIEDACAILQLTPDNKFIIVHVDISFSNIFDLNLPENLFIPGRTDSPIVVTDDIKGYAEYLKEEHNFKVDKSKLLLYGTCSECGSNE